MLKFTTHSMLYIMNLLESKLENLIPKDIIEFEVLSPDYADSIYSGNILQINDILYLYHGYKAWSDLAHLLKCRMLTPLIKENHLVVIRYQKLNADTSFHTETTDVESKYGLDSIFSQIHKMEEPAFVHYYKQALSNVHINKRLRILNLGVNSGDEFEFIQEYASNFKNLELIGVDYCSSAIKNAKEKFSNAQNISFYTHDINDLDTLNLGRFDLIISIGTLQSSNLEFNPLFMSIVQKQLKKDGAIILGFPNCRWLDGEMIYGARAKHYAFSEMSLVYKDAIFCKKYLQQKKFRVTITGKDYIFLTATSIRKD